jgi:hypothetical protein
MSRRLSVAVMLSTVLVWSMSAAGPTFRPDVVFKGSALTGWTPMGDAEWKAQNGEIIGRPKQPGGGWLVLDKSFQDVAVFSNVTCTGGCKAGVLLRAEKTPDGMKGIYVSLTGWNPGPHRREASPFTLPIHGSGQLGSAGPLCVQGCS